MPLNPQYLQELSELLLRNLRRSDYYIRLPESERNKLEDRLRTDAEEGRLPLLPGAHPDDLENLQDAVEEELGLELPASVVDILREIDGFNFNSVVLYGVDPELRQDGFHAGPGILVETAYLRSIYPENTEAYVFLGDSDLWYYAFDLKGVQAVALDQTNFAVAERFQSVEEMVNEMLRSAIGALDEASEEIL
jgi:hypothetical protein